VGEGSRALSVTMTRNNSSAQTEYQNGIRDFAKRGAWKVSSSNQCSPKMGVYTFSFWSFESGAVRGFMGWESAVVTIDCSTSFVRSLFFGVESRTRSFFRGRLR